MANLPIIREEARNPEYLTHTDEEHSFCSDVHCPCHDIQDGQYYRLICRPLLDGLMTPEEANRLYFGEQKPDTGYDAQADDPDPYEDDETGTHAPDCRCSWCEPQERNATTQCSDGSWW